jgi:hypothetical protein
MLGLIEIIDLIFIIYTARLYSYFGMLSLQLAGLPSTTVTASYQCRMIIRDITGKYCWDASILYGSKDPLATECKLINTTSQHS